jgi:hypothetical protein
MPDNAEIGLEQPPTLSAKTLRNLSPPPCDLSGLRCRHIRGVVFAHFLAQDRNFSAVAESLPSGQTAAITSGLGAGIIRFRLRHEPATQDMDSVTRMSLFRSHWPQDRKHRMNSRSTELRSIQSQEVMSTNCKCGYLALCPWTRSFGCRVWPTYRQTSPSNSP